LRGKDNGCDLTNIQYKPIRNCHYESPLCNKYILIKNYNKRRGNCDQLCLLYGLVKGRQCELKSCLQSITWDLNLNTMKVNKIHIWCHIPEPLQARICYLLKDSHSGKVNYLWRQLIAWQKSWGLPVGIDTDTWKRVWEVLGRKYRGVQLLAYHLASWNHNQV
jgi:hypothetical protein